MNLNIHVKISTGFLIRYLKLGVALLMIAGVIFMGFFLKENIYNPLTQAHSITRLKVEVATLSVQKKALQDVLAKIKERQAIFPALLQPINNPFIQVTTNPTPSSAPQNSAPSFEVTN